MRSRQILPTQEGSHLSRLLPRQKHMPPMNHPLDPSELAHLPSCRLLLWTVLPALAPVGTGAVLLFVLHDAWRMGAGFPWPAGAILALAFFFSFLLLLDAAYAWESRRRARRLLAVPLPDTPGIWSPKDLPLSAHGRIALARAAPVPSNWVVGHDGEHIYVVERSFGRWLRLARRPR